MEGFGYNAESDPTSPDQTEEEEGGIDDWMDIMVLLVITISLIMWYVGDARNKQRMKQQREEMRRLRDKMTIAPRDDWTVAELAPYTGGPEDDPQPILFAAKGCVYNVWRGRHFYGCEGSYHCFVGKDATTMLALELLDEPTQEQQDRPFTRDELNFLDEWISTFEWKYDNLGSLAPGEGIWEKEPEKRRLWDANAALYTPSAIAAAITAASVALVTAEKDGSKDDDS